MSLSVLHTGLANACTIFSLLIAGYGFWLFFRKQNVSTSFLGMLAIGQLLYMAQMVIGITLLAGGAEPPSQRGWVHYLYGVVLVIALPSLYAYTRGQDTRREALLYALMGLFLAGISLRAVATALP
jgi:uncharacterized membrane-anchored protein YitT (DUF2179 family)